MGVDHLYLDNYIITNGSIAFGRTKRNDVIDHISRNIKTKIN
jgi:hypothetical protein